MKTNIIRLGLVLLFIPFVTFATGPKPKEKTVLYAELNSTNCSKPVKDYVAVNQPYIIQIQFKNESEARDLEKCFYVKIGNGNAKKRLDGKQLNFELGVIYNSVDSKKPSITIFYQKDLKDPQKSTCVYTLDIFKSVDKKDVAKEDKSGILAFVKDNQLFLDLADLYINPADCKDDIYPGINKSIAEAYTDKTLSKDMIKKYLKNRAVYDARNNETYWVDSDGKMEILSSDHKIFEAKAGNPVTFEIVNVNPEAYRLSIKDTALSIFQESNAILNKLLSADGAIASGADGDQKKISSRKEVIKSVLISALASLNEFFLNQSTACDNLNFTLTHNKLEAKKRFDALMAKAPMSKPTYQSLKDFLESELDKNGEDSLLIKSVTTIYNKLSGSFYHMERLTNAQSGKDYLEFEYSVLARNNTPYLDKVNNQKLHVYIIRQFKVDVSAGLYFAPGLRNERYALRNDTSIITPASGRDTIDVKRLVKERNHAGEFGFNSYVHFYYKPSATFGVGGHIGAGVGLDDRIRPRYFFGLSFMFGKESGRIALNLSAVMGNTDVLSNQYMPLNQEYRSSKFAPVKNTENSVNYVTRFAIAPAIGISYNLPFGLSSKKQTP